MIVLDASAALAWILPGQSTLAATALRGAGEDFVAPEIFAVEIRNVLLKAERRRLITPEQADRAVAGFDGLVTLLAGAHDLERLYRLAREDTLSLFDAFYLDLAIAQAAELASRDGPLLASARKRGVAVRDLR